jgi:hypothetical protein
MSAPGFDLQNVLAQMRDGDWDVLKVLEERYGASPDARKARELAAEEEKALTAVMASLPDAFLDWLWQATWGRMTFSVMTHPDPQQALLYGAFREGQNALALTILKAVAQGRQTEQPPVKGESDVPSTAARPVSPRARKRRR